MRNLQAFNPYFVDKIKDFYTDKAYKKSRVVLQTHNDGKENLELI